MHSNKIVVSRYRDMSSLHDCISHLIVDEHASESVIEALYMYKCNHRHVKLLYEIHMQEFAPSPKTLVRTMTNNGCDGCIITCNNTVDTTGVVSLLLILKNLPSPYDFTWDVFIDISTMYDIRSVVELINATSGMNIYLIVNESQVSNDLIAPHVLLVAKDSNRIHDLCVGCVRHIFDRSERRDLINHSNNLQYPTSSLLKAVKRKCQLFNQRGTVYDDPVIYNQVFHEMGACE